MKRLMRKYAETVNWRGKTQEESFNLIKSSPYNYLLSDKYEIPPNASLAFWGYQHDLKQVDSPKIYVIELFQFNKKHTTRHDVIAVLWRYDVNGKTTPHQEVLPYLDKTLKEARNIITKGFSADSSWIDIEKLEDYPNFEKIKEHALKERKVT